MTEVYHPLVSIIMTTYNCADTIDRTLAAVEMQDYDSLEIVIKDGGSKDGTWQKLQAFQNSSTHRVIVRQSGDQGIYDAMNQGFALSHGDVLAFCSDLLTYPQVVSDMVHAIAEGGPSCVGAHADLVYAQGDEVKRYWHMGRGRIEQGWMPGHPTLYLKRQIYETYGLYDASYRIAADYEFMIRFLKDHPDDLAYVPKVIVSMYYGGTSTASASSYWKSLQEATRALKHNGIPHPWLVNARRTIRLVRQMHVRP